MYSRCTSLSIPSFSRPQLGRLVRLFRFRHHRVVKHWIPDHLPVDLSLTVLADPAAMSVRNFTRVFQVETGFTPAGFVEMARVDAVRRPLEDSDSPLQRVASRRGFATPDTMRRAFMSWIGTGPATIGNGFGNRAFTLPRTVWHRWLGVDHKSVSRAALSSDIAWGSSWPCRWVWKQPFRAGA
jgi:AraC-like DNA-binding protein